MHPITWIVQPNDRPGQRRPAVFLDRDGVLNENRVDYVRSWEQVVFLPGMFEAVQRLAASPFAAVVVTNQSAVGRGLMTADTLAGIHRSMVEAIVAAGGRVDAVYACPHAPADACTCRKPRPGMLLQAAQDLAIDLSRSFLVGDAITDLEAALAAGCRPVMVCTGRGRKQAAALATSGLGDVPLLADLGEAVEWILNQLRPDP